MLRPIGLATCVVLTVAGCARVAESRMNPLNWFGRSREVVATTPQTTKPLVSENSTVVVVDSRILIHEIVGMELAPTSSGAILRATGIAAAQGAFNAELVLESYDNGTATYGFRIETRAGAATGTPASRQVTVAKAIPQDELSAIRTVIVRSATNARSSGR